MVDYISNINIGKEVDSGVPDGENWALLTSSGISGGTNYYAITYGSNKFVALSSNGYISTCTDGTTWTTATQNTNLGSHSWYNIAYDGTKFVAIGSTGYISTSTDGTTWTTAVENYNLGSHSWRGIIYGNGKFVTLGSLGYVSTSTDGTTWTTAVQSAPLGTLTWNGALAYGNGKFVAISALGYTSTSTDGTTWTTATQNTDLGSHSWYGLTYDGTKFVALGGSGYISTSTDGTTWSTASVSSGLQFDVLGTHAWTRITHGGDKFVALEKYGTTSISFNSTSWANIAGLGSYNWDALEYGDDKFVAIGSSASSSGVTAYLTTSTDGITWTTPSATSSLTSSAIINAGWSSITYGVIGTEYVDQGYKFMAITSNGYISYSEDGTTWSTPALVSQLGTKDYWQGIASLSYYSAIIGATGYVSTSTDFGVTWSTASQKATLKNYDWIDLTSGDGHFVALDTDGHIAHSITSSNWYICTDVIPAAASGTWFAIKFAKGKFIALNTDGYISVGTIYYSAVASTEDNDNFQITWSTPTLDSSLSIGAGSNTWQNLTYGDGKFVAIGYDNGKAAISKNVNSSKISIGGDNFDGRVAGYQYQVCSIENTNATSFVSGSPFSLEEYLPDDDFDYEVQFSFTSWTTSTSNNNVGITVATGSVGTYDERFMTVSRVITRTSSTQGVWGTFWLPIYANDRHISIYQSGTSGKSGAGGLRAINYRRIGRNGSWSTASLNSSLNANSYAWFAGAYGNSKYALLGYHGDLATSSDGETWTVSSTSLTLSDTGDYWATLVYGNGKFVAVSYNGYISTSTDGTIWTTPASALTANCSWGDSIYDGSKFMIIGRYGDISTSTDGTTWTRIAASSTGLGSNSWITIAYANNTYIVVGETGYVSTSTDGTTWTTPAQDSTLGAGYSSWRDLEFIDNQFVLMGTNGYAAYSNTGSTWYGGVGISSWLASNENYWSSLIVGNKEYLAINQSGYISKLDNKVISNIDIGEEINFDYWTTAVQNTDLGKHNWQSITYGAGKFVALSYTGYISTSTDGTTWTTAVQNTDLGNHAWQSITYGAGKFVALALSGYISTSTDGTTWTTATQNTNLGSHSWCDIAYDGTKFVALALSGYISTSTDGTTWTTAVQNTDLGKHNWYGIAYGNGKFVALDRYGYISSSTDGTTWTTAVQNTDLGNNSWQSITYGAGKFVAVSLTGYISTSTDGTTWTTAVQNTNLGNNSWYGIAYGNGKFVVIDRNGYISINVPTKIPIGGKALDGQWQHAYIQSLVDYSFKVNSAISVDLSTYLPDDGCRYEILLGYLYVLTADGSGKNTRIGIKTGDQDASSWAFMAMSRGSGHERDARTCTVTVPAYDRRICFNNGNFSGTGTVSVCVTGYRRLSNNE